MSQRSYSPSYLPQSYSPSYLPPPQQPQSSWSLLAILKFVIGLVVLSVLGYLVYLIFSGGIKGLTESIADFITGLTTGLVDAARETGEKIKGDKECQEKHGKKAFGNVDGTCWKCPPGFDKNRIGIDPQSKGMCLKHSRGKVYGSKGCTGGYKKDLTLPVCWKCPSSHPIRTWDSVRSNTACATKSFLGIGAKTAPAITKSSNCSRYNSRVPGSHGKMKYHITKDQCFTCPKGSKHQILKAPRNPKACIEKSPATRLYDEDAKEEEEEDK